MNYQHNSYPVYEIKEVVQDLRAAARRRRVLLIITPILFLLIGIAVLHVIEPKYMSSTSILVQKDETLNPLVMFEMAVTIASENRLESFNEILYSRSTMEMLIDSLRLDDDVRTEAEKQALINSVRKNISTHSRASDSFEISYYDTDPVRARDGVSILASHFINTRLRLENRRNEDAVIFFTNKLAELEEVVDMQRRQVVNVTSDQMQELPSNAEALQSRLQTLDTQLDDLDWRIYQEEQRLLVLKNFSEGVSSGSQGAIQLLYKLPFGDIPFGEELSELLKDYETLRQQFTDSYPRVQSISNQIIQVTERIPPAINSNINRHESQREDIAQQRARVVNDMQRSFVATQRANTQQSDFSIYEGLYNEMRVKLEQAKMTRDIGQRGSEQFVVLDAPYVPEKPATPKKRLIIGAGLLFGVVIGVGISAVAEVMDTTLREEIDLPFDKPIIAYLSSGK